MTFSYDDVRRLASDPETDWDTLHRIAEEYPELRPAVAANPATYPELLEALADLDDPAVTAALMRRFNPDAADQAEAEADTGVEGEAAPDEPQETPPSDEPTSPSDGDRRDADPRAAGAAAPEVASAGPTPGEGVTPTPATPEPAAPDEPAEPAHAGTAAAGAAGAAAPEADAREDAEGPPPALQSSTLVGGAGAGISAADLQQRARRRRSRLGLVLLAVVLPLIAVVAIAALVVMLLGDRSDPQAEPDGAAANEQTASPSPSQEPSASQTPSPSPTGPTLQELHSAVAELPQNSTCDDVTDDVDVFTAYAELAAEEGSWSAEDDQLVQQTVEDLQAECGALQSAQVHQQLSDQTAAGLAAAAEDMGTGWIEAGFPAADDAAELTSFMMPSGNIRCEIGDRLRCTIVEHDFPAPEGCGDAAVTTYETTLRTTSAPDCEDPLQEADRQVLAYGEETANEYFGCQSLRAGVTCWNQISGEGFTLSRSDHSTY